MQRSTRNQAFAGSRQQTARNLINSLTDRGMKISEISKETRIATSTIAKWWHDSAPNPRTLARLEGLKSRIDEEEKRFNEKDERDLQTISWENEGGIERVWKFLIWLDDVGDGLRNDHPDFNQNFPHYDTEREHQLKGHRLGLCDNRIL